MAKRLKVRISRILQSWRSKDLPSNPVPSFHKPPHRPSLGRHVASILSCGFITYDPPTTFVWEQEDDKYWHVVVAASDSPRRKIYNSSASSDPDHAVSELPPPPLKQKKNRRRRRFGRGSASTTSSADDTDPPARSRRRRSRRMPVVKDSFAVVKRSEDPYEDFKRSMTEMIVEKEMEDNEDLEHLLHCFLSLNSRHHHGLIIQAFADIWDAMFSYTRRRSSSST